MAIVLTFTTAGTAAAVSYLALGTVNTAAATTTLKSGVNGAVLQLTNSNTAGGTAAQGLIVTVPAGRAPIKVNASAGKAVNLNADKLDGLDASALASRAQPAWRLIGATGEPPFSACSAQQIAIWSNYPDTNYNPASFYKDTIGNVHLRGMVSCLASFGYDMPLIFMLPEGYRPAHTEPRMTLVDDVLGRVDITRFGEVRVVLPAPTDGYPARVYLLLDGITFQAAP